MNLLIIYVLYTMMFRKWNTKFQQIPIYEYFGSFCNQIKPLKEFYWYALEEIHWFSSSFGCANCYHI